LKLGLVENCWWNSPVDPVKGITLAKEIGFDSYDVFLLDTPKGTRDAERKELKRQGLPCSSFIVAANGLTDFVPEMRRFTVQYVKDQADLGHELDSPTMVLVLGNYAYEQREFKPEQQWRWALEGVREVADYCSSLGIEIALEYVPYRFYLLNSVREMKRFIDDARHLAPFPDGGPPRDARGPPREGHQRPLLRL
jgi:D-psicose/D-tagatose/L-ribulose 3-epimerase